MRNIFLPLRRLFRFLPTGLTLGNSLCGFAAILQTLQAYAPDKSQEVPQVFAISAWLIIGAMFFDMLDGWAARLLHADSEYGIEMDSLADMVTFGVAPAVMMAVMAHTSELDWLDYRLVWTMCAIYLACVALRLALYNVKARQEHKSTEFHGLPSPGGAAAVCSLVILNSRDASEFMILRELLPLYATVLGFLMVSSIPYAHLGHWLGDRKKYKLKLVVIIAFFMLFSWRSRLVAAVVINLYVLSGPVRALLNWRTSHPVEAEA